MQAYPATGIKGDIFFNIFKNRCHEEPEFMQRLRVCFQFNLTKDGKPVCIWSEYPSFSPFDSLSGDCVLATYLYCTCTPDPLRWCTHAVERMTSMRRRMCIPGEPSEP